MKILFACLLIVSAFLSGCYYDSQENLYPSLNNSCKDTVNVTYNGTIKPILNNYCNSCHYTGAADTKNVNLDSYNGVVIAVNNQNLLSSITHDGTVKPMPNQGGKLDNCSIAAFSIWIKAKTPNN